MVTPPCTPGEDRQPRSRLSDTTPLADVPTLRCWSAIGGGLRVIDRDPELAGVIANIRAVYATAFGADIHPGFPRYLVTGEPGGDVASLGLRYACEGPIFLEQYLDQRVELALRAVAGRPVDRDRVVEFGHLVGTGAGALARMMAALFRWGRLTTDEFVTIVLTRPLARRVASLGVRLQWLADAGPASVTDPASWGRYYTLEPAVYAVDLVSRRAGR